MVLCFLELASCARHVKDAWLRGGNTIQGNAIECSRPMGHVVAARGDGACDSARNDLIDAGCRWYPVCMFKQVALCSMIAAAQPDWAWLCDTALAPKCA